MHKIESLFSTPVYLTHRDMGLSSFELGEIKDIINKEMYENERNFISNGNTHIFETKLKNLRNFVNNI